MPDLQCLKVKIKHGLTDYAVEWIQGMKDRDPDGLNEALANEGMIIESIFLDRTFEADYLVIYHRAEDLLEANRSFNRSTRPFDETVRKFVTEVWGDSDHLDLVIDHERTSDGYRHTLG